MSIPYSQKRLIKWLVIMLLTFQFLFHLSDSAMTYLFSFISGYFYLLASTLQIESLTNFSKAIPPSLSRARSIIEVKEEQFKVFSSCPSCDTIYEVDNCIDHKDKCKQSNICRVIEFPNHPHKGMRYECGSVLMKTCRSPSGSTFLYPVRPFCYRSISKALESMMYRIRPHICVTTINSDSLLTDIYDGRIWKEFIHFCQQHSSALCLSLTLNVDWFQPYDHLKDSIGAMYLIINLLRHMQFKQQNVLLVGMIPGPSEPRNINAFLSPPC